MQNVDRRGTAPSRRWRGQREPPLDPLLGAGGSVNSTGGSAGAIGATVAGVVGAGAAVVSAGVVTAAEVSLGVVRAGSVTLGDTFTGAAAGTVTTGIAASAVDAARSGVGLPVGSVIVPSGDGNSLIGVLARLGVTPSGASAEGVLAIPVSPAGATSLLIDWARSAAPNAAVMPRIAVAERPVDKMRAERATWRSRFGRRVGSSVVIVVVSFTFLFFVVVIVLALLALLVVVVIVVMATRRRGSQVAAGRSADRGNNLTVDESGRKLKNASR